MADTKPVPVARDGGASVAAPASNSPGIPFERRSHRTPCNDATCVTCTPSHVFFSTAKGQLVASKLSVGPDDIPFFSVQSCSRTVCSDGVALDLVFATGDDVSSLLACFLMGTQITLLEFDRRSLANDSTFQQVASRMAPLPENVTYTNRSSAHCWCDHQHLAVGGLDGGVYLLSAATGAWVMVLRETTPVVELCWYGDTSMFVVSSTARSGVAELKPCESLDAWTKEHENNSQPVPVVQIGQKARPVGLFGACMSSLSHRVFTARPARRIFEGDPSSGSVYRTLRLLDCNEELCILKSLPLCVANAGNYVITESPTFIALIDVTETTWKYSMSFDKTGVVCSAFVHNYLFVLTNDDNVYVLKLGDVIPIAKPEPPPHTVPLPEEAPTPAVVQSATVPLPPKAQEQLQQSSTPPDRMTRDVPQPQPPVVKENEVVKETLAGGEIVVIKKKKRPAGKASAKDTSALPNTNAPAGETRKRIVRKRRTMLPGATQGPVVAEPMGQVEDDDNEEQQFTGPTDPLAPVISQPNETKPDIEETAAEPLRPSSPESPPPTSITEVEPPQADQKPPTAGTTTSTPAALSSIVVSGVDAAALPPAAPPPDGVKNGPLQSNEASQSDQREASQKDLPVPAVKADSQIQLPQQCSESGPAVQPPSESEVREKAMLASLLRDTETILATYRACSLDQAKYPLILADILQWAPRLRDGLQALECPAPREGAPPREGIDEETLKIVEVKLSRDDILNKSLKTLVIGLEWIADVDMPPSTDRFRCASELVDMMDALFKYVHSVDTKCTMYERVCRAISHDPAFHELVQKVCAACMSCWSSQTSTVVFPPLAKLKLTADETIVSCDEVANDGPLKRRSIREHGVIEQRLAAIDPSVIDEIQKAAYPCCFLNHYFPYIVVVFPSKAIQVAVNVFPLLSIQQFQWSASLSVHRVSSHMLQSVFGIDNLTVMNGADLKDLVCDFVCILCQHSAEKIAASLSWLVPCLDAVLKRRLDILPVAAQSTLNRRKVALLENCAAALLKACKIKLTVAYPDIIQLFDKCSYPQGIVELKAVDPFIMRCAEEGRLEDLLPLFSLESAITETHWITLFTAAFDAKALDRAFILCLTVVQNPKTVRYLVRRAFPLIDTPGQSDDQLRSVIDKIALLIM